MAKKQSPTEPQNSVADLRRGKSASKAAKPTTWENIKAIVITLAIFLVIRTFLVEAYRIPSGSMIPTLLIGDWLFVNKLAYGPHVPGTDYNLPGYNEPKRGDVIVFRSPPQLDMPEDMTPTLVKRLVAVGGDTVYMRGGMFYVNGVAQPPVPNNNPIMNGGFSMGLFNWQHSYELAGSRFGEPPAIPTLDDWGPLVVPENHLFFLGDNRYDSKDSRYWGFVPRDNVRGRPIFVYYSYNADDSDRALPFLTDIRWKRIGTVIR